ncbi:hypothetical protein [Halopiger djelfimassiliensis]|uniref:hypothetical protein n=1 Tax=Halopiger djelfimassiliensis TaxID=1293047 RepID=UPI000677DEE9|nr:hypothetical protein [Halopiger djelfimassiliensis]
MATSRTAPNERVRDTYDRLAALLEQGDDAFIEEGPSILQDAIEDEAFFDGVETEHAEESYTRRLVHRESDGPVIRFMEWPPEYTLMPHEHHGRPCFEVLVDGQLFLADMEAENVSGNEYELDVIDGTVCGPGEAGVVDPRTGTDIHAVYSPVRTRSLHVYPDDNHYGIGYVPTEASNDRYRSERFQLRD